MAPAKKRKAVSVSFDLPDNRKKAKKMSREEKAVSIDRPDNREKAKKMSREEKERARQEGREKAWRWAEKNFGKQQAAAPFSSGVAPTKNRAPSNASSVRKNLRRRATTSGVTPRSRRRHGMALRSATQFKFCPEALIRGGTAFDGVQSPERASKIEADGVFLFGRAFWDASAGSSTGVSEDGVDQGAAWTAGDDSKPSRRDRRRDSREIDRAWARNEAKQRQKNAIFPEEESPWAEAGGTKHDPAGKYSATTPALAAFLATAPEAAAWRVPRPSTPVPATTARSSTGAMEPSFCFAMDIANVASYAVSNVDDIMAEERGNNRADPPGEKPYDSETSPREAAASSIVTTLFSPFRKMFY